MLPLQEVETRLQQYQLEDGEQQRLTAVAALPRRLRAAAWQLLG